MDVRSRRDPLGVHLELNGRGAFPIEGDVLGFDEITVEPELDCLFVGEIIGVRDGRVDRYFITYSGCFGRCKVRDSEGFDFIDDQNLGGLPAIARVNTVDVLIGLDVGRVEGGLERD